MDSNTKLPIKGAHVICIDKYYKFIEAINVGGPNSDYLAIHITATDSNGYFKLPSYFKWTFPSSGLREILIYKEGYYSPIYFQSGKDSFYFNPPGYNHLDIESDYFSNLYLTENINDREGFILDFSTTARSLISRTIYCAQDLSWHNKSKFNQFRPAFEKIHSILSKSSVRIKEQLSIKRYSNTTTERVLKDWDKDLRNLKMLIRRSDTGTTVNTIEQRVRNSSGVVHVKSEARH
ncbi:hypothetical protein [Desulfospira joergensenii]|uniref:hypothetical protein n=1 Tax=Desulfospira joergensenii TaxID=53329 RepID=UPI0003B3507C|nr:hypothetical protein [Desulfospira joergensenii]